MGYSAAAYFLADFLAGCSKVDQVPRVDFVLDLTDPNYSNLYNLGGYVYSQGVIVFRGVDGNYYALSQVCTHQGCDVEYQAAYDEIVCPCHGSHYDIHGNVTMGPASVALFEYVTQLFGTQLHVYTPK